MIIRKGKVVMPLILLYAYGKGYYYNVCAGDSLGSFQEEVNDNLEFKGYLFL